jgi:hypothetical protein
MVLSFFPSCVKGPWGFGHGWFQDLTDTVSPAQKTPQQSTIRVAMPTSEAQIQAAIADLNSGVLKSARTAAKVHGVPRLTLQGRLHGATNARASHAHLRRLTPEHEALVFEWIFD